MDQSYDTSMSCRSSILCDNDYKINSIKQNKSIFTETNESLLSWTQKHPENWSDSEILDWVYFVADVQRFDGSKVRGEAYQNLTGSKLCHMSKEEFINRDPDYGSTMHQMFRQLVGTATFCAPIKPETFNYEPVYDSSTTNRNQSLDDTAYDNHLEGTTNSDLLDFSVLIGGHLYDIDVESKLSMFPETEKTDLGYVSGDSGMSEIDHGWETTMHSTAYDLSSTDEDINMASMPMMPYSRMHLHTKRRLQSGSVSSEDGSFLDQRPIRPKPSRTGGSKGNHLWEFVRDLLKDSSVNPSLLKWEDKSTGVFRFVSSEAIAQMWGKKKNNRMMTYEKLSRAMRFCRSAGYFEAIPKNGKFPKKLCFKFGPKAHGWQD